MSLRKLIKEISLTNPHFNGYLYHGTQIVFLDHLKENGFWKNTHFGSYRIADFFANNPSDEIYGRGSGTEDPIIIEIPFHMFNKNRFKIDYNMLEEPLTYTLGISEEEVSKLWYDSEQDVQASLDILESAIYEDELPWSDNFQVEYL